MRNLCSDYSPLLATRSRRMLYKTLQDPGGLFCWDKLCWVDGTTFYYDGVAKGTVTARPEDLHRPGSLHRDLPGQGILQHGGGRVRQSGGHLDRCLPHLHQRETV